MPIVVKHSPVGALGQLAVSAGQARGAQIRADQDLQFTSMALAARDRSAQIGMAARDRASEQAFRFQQAASTQIAKRQAVSPDTRDLQLRLQRTVKEAQTSGIYTPVQLKQMQIKANMGDERGLASFIGREPTAPRAPVRTARRRELDERLEVHTKLREKKIAPLRKQLEFLEGLFGRRLGPNALDRLRQDPQFLQTIPKDLQSGFETYRQIEQMIADQELETDRINDRIQSGFSLPQQETVERRQAAGIQRQETAAEKQKRTDAYRKLRALSAKQNREVARVNLIEGRNQRRLERQIAAEQVNLKFDPYDDPEPQKIRIQKAKDKIEEFETELKASYKRQDEANRITVGSRQTPGEETALLDSLLEEAFGDSEGAKRLLKERSSP